MKNIVKLFGIIALVAVIGFSMAACGDDDDSGGDGGGSSGGDNSPYTYTINFNFVGFGEDAFGVLNLYKDRGEVDHASIHEIEASGVNTFVITENIISGAIYFKLVGDYGDEYFPISNKYVTVTKNNGVGGVFFTPSNINNGRPSIVVGGFWDYDIPDFAGSHSLTTTITVTKRSL